MRMAKSTGNFVVKAYNCSDKLMILIFFSIFLLFAAILPVYAGGSRDQELSKADALIKEKEFDEAISILTEFSRNHPERFDEVQSRLRQIYKLREEFNRAAEELINTLLNDPDNNEKILELSTKLYSLEKGDSPLLVNFVSRTRGFSQFNVNRTMLRDILQKGGQQVKNRDSVAAMQTYAGGLTFMRDEFFTMGYGKEIEESVIRETNRVNAMIASFQQAVSQAVSLSSEVSRAISSGDMSRINQSITALMPAVDRLIALKNELYTAVNIFDDLLNQLQEDDPELGDRCHLAFLTVLINGRSGEAIQEGMLGAFDAAWKSSAGSNLDVLSSYLETANNVALTSFNAGNYQAAIASLNRIENYYGLAGQFFTKHLQYFRQTGAGSEKAQTISALGNTIITVDIPQYAVLRALNEANMALRAASNIAMRHSIDPTSLTRWQEGRINVTAAFSAEQQARDAIKRTQSEIEDLTEKTGQINAEIKTYYNVTHITNVLNAVEKYRLWLLNEEIQSARRYYTIAHNNISGNIIAGKEEMKTGRNYLDGIKTTDENGTDEIHYYPTEAMETLTRMNRALASELESNNAVLARYGEEADYITSNAEIIKINTGYRAVINEMSSLYSQGLTLAETARTRSTQAEAYRQEAERLYRDGQAAYQRQDFELARERVTQAAGRINNSLEIQESPSLRSTWNMQLLNLGESISRAENEVIIAEVRGLLNTARSAYYAGNYQQAEDNLVRARNRWRVTNPEDNDEVLYWLGLIRTALSARTGRTIPVTAPLFAEMSQLNSQAHRSYEEGTRLINTGQRALGLAKLEEARRMTREVRLMFPFNQEAGILELRIEQFIDPRAFTASFELRLRTAVAGTRQRSLEAFADLQNLAEINPGYPNIRSILTQAEIDMGFRPPPPNPANIARSRDLTASVNRIIDGSLAALYNSALAQIDEAIALNPENADAMRAKDRLLARMSVPGTIVLSSEDEETYQRAMRELQAGNTVIARALIERLMQNPRNRNITKLVELQRRLQFL